MRAIAAIDLETDYLGEPGEGAPWAVHAEEHLRQLRATDEGVYFLACEADGIVGYVSAFAGELRRTRSVVLIAQLGVRAAHRRRGIGTRLLAAAEAWARDQDARRIELRVDEENVAAVALYRRHGFLVEGRITDAVWLNGRWHAHWLMARSLSEMTAPRRETAESPPPPGVTGSCEVTLRTPQSADAAALQAFEWELLTASPLHLKLPAEIADVSDIEADVVAASQNPRRFVLVAVAGSGPTQAVVGCIQAWPAPAARMRHDILFTLGVLPSFGGCGVGRALVQALEAWARGRSLHRLTTCVLAHDARALRFAAACGFCRETLSQDYVVIDGRSVDRVGLGKILA